MLDRLHAIVGDTGVITDDYDKSPYLNDERGYYTGATPMVVRPASTEEVSEIGADLQRDPDPHRAPGRQYRPMWWRNPI